MNTPPRHHSYTRGLLASIAVAIPAMLIGSGLSAPPAQAAFTVTLEQVGTSVVATGSGSIDTTDLTFLFPGGIVSAGIASGGGTIATGASGATDAYTGFTGPTSFGNGSGNFISASSGSGNIVDLVGDNVELFLPNGYVSGSALSDGATYNNETLTSLATTLSQTVEWTWGSGAHADSFTLQIGPAAVPAPLIGHGLLVLLAVGGVLFGSKLLERRKKLGFHQFG